MNKSLIKLFVLIGIFIVGFLIGRTFNIQIDDVRTFFGQFPLVLSGIVFVITYVASTTFILFGPKDVLRVSAALIFGPMVSTVFVWFGEICNAAILFSLSRKLGREYVQRKFKVKYQSIQGIHQKGMSVLGIFALRINPLVPFRLMDLSFGLGRVSLRKYVSVCLFGSVPRIFWLQYIIHGVGENLFQDTMSVYTYLIEHRSVLLYSVLYFVIILIMSLIAVVESKLRKKRKLSVIDTEDKV